MVNRTCSYDDIYLQLKLIDRLAVSPAGPAAANRFAHGMVFCLSGGLVSAHSMIE